MNQSSTGFPARARTAPANSLLRPCSRSPSPYQPAPYLERRLRSARPGAPALGRPEAQGDERKHDKLCADCLADRVETEKRREADRWRDRTAAITVNETSLPAPGT